MNPFSRRPPPLPMAQELIPRITSFWLLVINLAVLTPLYDELTPWTLAICAICFVWRIGIFLGKVARPPRLLVSVLAMASAATLLLITGQLGTLSTLINLLILGYALKFIEMRQRRDVKAIILVGYFLIALTFVNNQSILSTLHLLLVTVVNTAGLISLYQGKTRPLDPLTGALTITLLSLPLAALLFLVLPRFSPLWMVPDTNKATTGLSDTVRPGDIRNLTRSAQLAFRATFYGDVPPNEQLYWRALVLDSYDGKAWNQNPTIKALQANTPAIANQRRAPKGYGLSYQVIAEPSGTHWLFSLDLGYSDSRGVVNLADARLFAKRRVEQQFGYEVTSYFDAIRDQRLSVAERQQNLYLPPDSNPRTREWGQQLARQYPHPAIRVQQMMNHFAAQPYFYTLSPPATGVNQVDDFLFDNRAGFCVHYASALVVLARASGLPARMVTGYQGGEYNATAGYVSVYQYMAHAWTEIWLPERGWVSFDPTAMVAPERVLDGFDALFSPEESYLLDNPLSSLRLKNWPWLDQWRLYLSSLDYYWSVWVLGFNGEKQTRMLKALLGSASTERIGLLMLGGILAVLVLLGWYTGLLRLPRRRDKLLRRYHRLLQALRRLGVELTDGDGPRTVAAKVSRFNPHWQDAITRITDAMEHLMFDPTQAPQQKSELKSQCLNQIERLLLLLALHRSTPTLMRELPGKAAR
ncbi:transglutaminase TgpA family protein [Shewanella sp. GXUN23E]|uniref:transglutaminase TgpA family protein n=1 Tax=Shewanella sp. GXUN23E TaxID=3422498 RepID=UPI003D7C8866